MGTEDYPHLLALLEQMYLSLSEKWVVVKDPYDVYVQSLRSKLHSGDKEFYESCLRGYSLLYKKGP